MVLLACVVSLMTASDSAVIDEQSWNDLERLDVCSAVDNPSVVETCSLCPAALPGVSVWRCCHDPRAFADCAAAVDRSLAGDDASVDKRRTKFFLGKKRGTKFFLGKRSFDEQAPPAADKRVKYFLG